MPPALAIAIAILDSVTVSIADEIIGIFKFKFLERDVFVITSEGKISEYLGVNKTSSNVSASLIGSMSLYICFFENLKRIYRKNLQIIKLSFDSFLLAAGLKTLLSLNIFFASATISLNVDPINIFETNFP